MKTKLSEEARKARNEYYRKWREEHHDQYLESQRRYREKRRAEVARQRADDWEKRTQTKINPRYAELMRDREM